MDEKPLTPEQFTRKQANVPGDNHEIRPMSGVWSGTYTCRACPGSIFTLAEANAHVATKQFRVR